MIHYAEGHQTDNRQKLLQHSKQWLYKIMDHRQEYILTYAIDSIQKNEMCA